MSSRPPVLVTVSLSPTEYRPFVLAVSRLRRILGAKAPDTGGLIQTNLRGRDARGLAEDYLDSIGWPHAKRRPKRTMWHRHPAWAGAVRPPRGLSRN